ncbi:MAG: hypothetical protein NE328_15190, partial [Lentisphaeraceae bacterium]|nr:hypothetical protein [Lentisphaeraceae bacterium]
MKTVCVLLTVLCLCVSNFGQSTDDRADILKVKVPEAPKSGFGEKFFIENGQTVALVGGGNFEFEDQYGWLETRLRTSFKGINFKFRNISWEGDSVYERMRDHNYGSMLQHLAYLKADIVFLQYGQMEIFEKTKSLNDFRVKYRELLED